jgi:RimJ/RimL family protein N-acetyltransferase
VTIETPRLRLRDWREEDIEPFIRRLNTEPAMRWLGGLRTAGQQEAAVRERFMAWREARGFTFWWGQGYAKEAALASLDFAFARLGSPYMVA